MLQTTPHYLYTNSQNTVIRPKIIKNCFFCFFLLVRSIHKISWIYL